MNNDGPSRELLERLTNAAKAYRDAFETLEATIAHEANPNLPTWVFNLDSFNMDNLNQISPTIAYAERHRRAARVALHAVAELLALDDPASALAHQSPEGTTPVGNAVDMNNWLSSLTARAGDDLYWLRTLDRFVGIVNYADGGGCLYLNGTFEPIMMHDEPDDQEVTAINEIPRRASD